MDEMSRLPKHTNPLPGENSKIKPPIRINAIPIPENATNGDMIKAIFPNVEIFTIVINEIVDVEICEDSSELRCSVDWWNSPYKKRGDEGANSND